MRRATLRARIAGSVGVVALAAGMSLAFTGVAAADTPSDARATFHEGNATTCDDVGFGDSVQVGADGNASASDSEVSGVVVTNAGTIQPGQGEEVDVTILGSNVVIDAVVVKGGNGYNVYDDPSVLPPSLQPPQHYISPLNGGGNVPAVSHWFICYHLAEGPTTGSLSVTKVVVPPADPTAISLVPTSFDVLVSCDSGDFNITVVPGTPSVITGLPDGDICTVVETSVLPAGSATPAYVPADADTAGVEVTAGTSVGVQITNDFTQVAGEVVVVNPPAAQPVAVAPAFTG
jgi:hypothetical protein